MSQSPDFPVEGGCACGTVRYRLLEDPLELHVCHCTDCQTVSGSAFIMCMAVHTRSLELVQGDLVTVSFKSPDGLAKSERHCPDCSCRVWCEIEDLADVLALQAGTLDDTSWIEPIAHIWTSSAQPWIKIPTDVLVYEKQPADGLELVRAWKGRKGA